MVNLEALKLHPTWLQSASLPHSIGDLDWFVEWRPLIWSRAVRRVVGATSRFQGKHLLELGYRSGRMSCYFALLGATVDAVDLPDCDRAAATALSRDLGVADRVRFRTYDGDVARLGVAAWDFVFTKSVLVVLPLGAAVAAIRNALLPGGEYLACENRILPFGLNRLRRNKVGVSAETYAALRRCFTNVSVENHLGIVSSIVASA